MKLLRTILGLLTFVSLAHAQSSYSVSVKWDQLRFAHFRNDTLSQFGASYYGQAVSKNTLPGNNDGAFKYVIDNMSHAFSIGFLDSISPVNANAFAIDYGFYYAYGTFYMINHGDWATITKPLAGDTLKVKRTGDTVTLMLNGTTLHRESNHIASQKNWKLISFVGPGAFLSNVKCSFSQWGQCTFPDYLQITPYIVHSSTYNAADGSVSLIPDQASTYSYTWQPGASSGPSVSSKAAGAYTLTAKDSVSHISAYTYNIGYKVLWDQLFNIRSNVDTLFSTHVYPPSEPLKVYEIATAVSKNTLAGGSDGWFEYVIRDVQHLHEIGFLDSISPSQENRYDIDYGFYCENGQLYTVNEGNFQYAPVIYPGDVLRVERVGASIRFKINGVTITTLTNATAVQKNWKLKVQLYQNASIINVGCSFYQTGHIAFPNYFHILPYVTHSSGPSINDGAIQAQPVQNSQYTYTWQPNASANASVTAQPAGSYTLTIGDTIHHQSTETYHIGYKTAWENLHGLRLSHDSIISANTSDWSQATSKNTLQGGADGWFEATLVDLAHHKEIGFLDSISPNYIDNFDIDYGYYYQAGSLYTINQNTWTYLSYYSPPSEGDVLRIERVGNVINYKINNVIVYTVTSALDVQKDWKLKGLVFRNTFFYNVGVSKAPMEFSNITTQDVSCVPSQTTGSVSVTMSGGKTPMTYTFDAISTSTVGTKTGLTAGTHTVQVADADGYTVSQTFTISQCPAWTTTTTPLTISTKGDVTKTGGINGWDDGYLMTSQLFRFKDTAAWISFDVADTLSSYMLGFRSVTGDSISQQTNYKFYIENAMASLIETDNDGFYNKMQISKVNPGSHIKIQFTNNGIEYYRSTSASTAYELVYTSRLFSSSPLIIEGILNRTGSKVANIRVSGNGN